MIIVDPWSALTVCVIAVGDRGGVNLQLVWLVGRMMEKDTVRTLHRNPLTVDRTFSDHQVSIAPIFPVSSNLRKNIPCKPLHGLKHRADRGGLGNIEVDADMCDARLPIRR